MQSPEHDRCRHHDFAARDGIFTANGPLGVVDLLEDAPARGDVCRACVGQPCMARGAMEQPTAQICFEIADAAVGVK